jgi:hypothetical protein
VDGYGIGIPGLENIAVRTGGYMANVWDRFGRLIGSVNWSDKGDANTYDDKGQPLGKVRTNGTYEARGNKISSTRDPGLTFGKRK